MTEHPQYLRAPILLALMAVTLASPALAQPAPAINARRTVSLLNDPSFRGGMVVWSPVDGKKDKLGELRPFNSGSPIAWGLAQWHSRFNLADARPEPLNGGAVRYRDAAKSVVFGPAGSPFADFVLALDARQEYSQKLPNPGDAWPHLLVEQPLRQHPRLTELESLRFQLEYRLLTNEALKPAGWDDNLHAAQLLFYVTVQNKRKGAEFDYYWFGLRLFDSRYRIPPAYAAADFSTAKKQGTGKFIFLPACQRFTDRSAHDWQWIRLDVELVPLVNEGLKMAWDRGYLAGSHDPDDYCLGTMNIGWEVTGPINVAAQLKNFDLSATVKTDAGR